MFLRQKGFYKENIVINIDQWSTGRFQSYSVMHEIGFQLTALCIGRCGKLTTQTQSKSDPNNVKYNHQHGHISPTKRSKKLANNITSAVLIIHIPPLLDKYHVQYTNTD